MRLVLVTDAWRPQINGVVNVLGRVVDILRGWGDSVTVIAPDRFNSIPCPSYPEIRLALPRPGSLARLLEESRPDAVHVATEGPLGLLARRACLQAGRSFTTSYHTRFPEYLAARVPHPIAWSYAWLRRFHNAGAGCMVATESLRQELAGHGFSRLLPWPRGVDRSLFRVRPAVDLGLPRPVFLNVGRVAIEKNLEAFLSLDLPGSKVVIGDGPARHALSRAFPDAHFLGMQRGLALAQSYSSADVFVFPSRTDTFGNVLLEALACGVPVAAFPVTGPKDFICDPRIGALDWDLRAAALAALSCSRAAARAFTADFSWEASASAFRRNIVAANSIREGSADRSLPAEEARSGPMQPLPAFDRFVSGA